MLKTIILKKNKEKKILSGFLWIYDNEIEKIPEECKNGEIVFIADNLQKKIAIGYLNRNSKITIRILDFIKNKNIIDFNIDDLLKKRIEKAIAKRENIKNTNAKRLIFSEADFLPGLIVDQYDNLLVLQITTLGMEKLKERIIKILDEKLNPDFIYEKSIGEVREKEGIQKKEGLIKPQNGKVPEIIINENGMKFLVKVDTGSKTGFYLDQRENRQKIKEYVFNKKVLDCFCYTGAFSVYALKYGASFAVGIDISENALRVAEENMRLNDLNNYKFIKKDVFDALKEFSQKKEKFDVIILDPPPFSKTEKQKKDAIRGYEFIHEKSFEILEKNGVIFTFSCSQNISQTDLLKIINKSAAKTRTLIEIKDFLSQAKDHPFIKSIPETFYLKGIIAKKI